MHRIGKFYGNDDTNLNQILPFYRKSKNFDIK